MSPEQLQVIAATAAFLLGLTILIYWQHDKHDKK